MDSLQQIIDAIGAAPGGVPAVAAASGVNIHTLIKIVNGATENPRYETFLKLDKWHRSINWATQ